MDNTAKMSETKQFVRQAIIEEGISPNTLIRLSDLAKVVLQDPSAYPQFVQAMIQSGLEEKDFSNQIDYKLVGIFAVLGDMVRQMIASGELGA